MKLLKYTEKHKNNLYFQIYLLKQPKDLKPELQKTICQKLFKTAESYKPLAKNNQERLKSLKLAFEQKDRAVYRKFDGIVNLVSRFNI